MKALGLVLVPVMGILLLSSGSATAYGFSLTSPDRPPVWYNLAGDKVSQELDWDRSKQELVSYIAYSRVEFTPERDQTLYDTFHLTFPMVRLDESTDQLYFVGKNGHRVTIGHLESGFLGTRVVLNDDVRFSENRRDGVVRAMIASAGSAER
jgi:hypothetical protein